MMRRLSRLVVAILVLVALAACASKPVSSQKLPLRKIALIPASEPSSLTLSNENGVMAILVPISTVAFHLDSKAKAKKFNEQMATRHMGLAQKLTTTVVDALRGAGYSVEVYDDIARPIDDPDDIDYAKLSTDAEMILQLRVDEVGLYSSKLSSVYLPRVNVAAKLYVRRIDDSLYDENLYFGVDAKQGQAQSIPADPKYAYSTFDEVIAKADEISGVFEAGMDAIAQLTAAQLLQTLATRTRPEPPG